MDYAEYVSRRPPSPPNLTHKHRPFTPSPSLSSTPTTVSTVSTLSTSSDLSRTRRPARHADRTDSTSAAVLSSTLHRRALRDEYAALAHTVHLAMQTEALRHRQESVRIRLEHMLTLADSRSLRVLHLALEKCNAKLDHLAASSRRIDDARARMRLIESKHFLGLRAPASHLPDLRTLHIRRERVATLVEHIQCTLYDQVRIHYLLTTLSGKVQFLRTHLNSLDRADRPRTDLNRSDFEHDRETTVESSGRDSMASDSSRRHFPRRISRGNLRANHMAERSSSRGNALRSQRSLPRKSEPRLIPLVVKRALSYNASNGSASQQPSDEEASWWGDTVPTNVVPDSRVSKRYSRVDSHDDSDVGEEEHFPGSPISASTSISSGSPPGSKQHGRLKAHEVDEDHIVLVDVDSLCTEASSVLSSSRGVDSSHGTVRRESVTSMIYHGSSTDSMRSKAFARLKLSKMRMPSQVKKLWVEINELYGMILTHGPHLVEEKIVPQASISSGILGQWNSRRGKSASVRTNVQISAVAEGARKLDCIVLWQQQLIVAIRKDLQEQRKVLLQADSVISDAYLRSLEAQDKDGSFKTVPDEL